MKDYTLNSDDKRGFILNYNVKDNQIIVNYADGEALIYPYSSKFEKEVLEKMKKQVINSDNYDKMINKKLDIYKTAILYGLIVTLPISAGILHFILATNFIGTILSSGILALNCLSISKRLKDIEKLKEQKNDLKKNKLFVANELLFQTKINKEMPLNTNIKKYTINLIKSVYKKKEENHNVVYPTINDIDKFSCEAVDEVYTCITNGLIAKKNKLIKYKKKIIPKYRVNIK